MRRFHLVRLEDVTGVSGIGRVAEGVEFHDGRVEMSWFGPQHTSEGAPDWQTIIAIHGHGGRTVIEWLDEEEQ